MRTTSTFSQIYSSICKSSFCYTYNGACAFHALQVYQPTVKAQCVSAVYRQSVYLLPVQQCFQLQGSLSFVSSPQCKYMNFIYLKSSFITWMVYLDPTHRPVGLLAQLVERCTGIAEVMSSNYFQLLIQKCSQLRGSPNFVFFLII